MADYSLGMGVSSLDLVLHANDAVYVYSGGVAVGTDVAGGTQYVSQGGSARFTTVGSGGHQFVSQGWAVDTQVASGGSEFVTAGTSLDAVIAAGGVENVFRGGVASGATVHAGGLLEVFASGQSLGAVIEGGEQDVDAFGTASGTVLQAGAVERLCGLDAVACGTVISSGSFQFVLSGAAASGTEVLSGGTARVYAGGTLEAVRVEQGGAIALVGWGISGGSATYDAADGTLTLTQGARSVELSLAGDYTGDSFQLAWDAGGGDLVVSVEGTPCLCRGTRVLTVAGERPVESLAIGDVLITEAGARAAIRWIGWRRYDAAQTALDADLSPVVIRRGALADGVPRRDLAVSPRHALWLDGVLIPAGLLVNDGSIVGAARGAEVEYLHLELAAHAVILAEGAAVESYVCDGNRAMFANAAEYQARYGEETPAKPAIYCAPRLAGGAAVARVWARLAARGAALGYHAGCRMTVTLTRGCNRFLLPPHTSALRLLSQTGTVAGDRRDLGALITEITLADQVIDLAAPFLGHGFHPPERHQGQNVRWTNGEAVLELARVPRTQGCTLRVATLMAPAP